jgi:hypothetical protein
VDVQRQKTEHPSSNQQGGSGKPTKRHLLNFTLRGLPELSYFDNEEQRQRALQEIGGEAGNIRSGGFWLAIVLLVGAAVAARFIAAWLLSYVQWHHELEDLLRVLAMITVAVFVLRRLHRWGAASDLRHKLLQCRIPVCLKCGYLLRGLPAEPGRCPECGIFFSDEVKAILHRAAK